VCDLDVMGPLSKLIVIRKPAVFVSSVSYERRGYVNFFMELRIRGTREIVHVCLYVGE
jgi:hypothetical protein